MVTSGIFGNPSLSGGIFGSEALGAGPVTMPAPTMPTHVTGAQVAPIVVSRAPASPVRIPPVLVTPPLLNVAMAVRRRMKPRPMGTSGLGIDAAQPTAAEVVTTVTGSLVQLGVRAVAGYYIGKVTGSSRGWTAAGAALFGTVGVLGSVYFTRPSRSVKANCRRNGSGGKPMSPSRRKAVREGIAKYWADVKAGKRRAPKRKRVTANCRCNGSDWTPADRKVGGQYGAPMGRRSDSGLTGKLHLRRVPLDRGGYDRGGAYWGVGAPLWVAWDDEGNERYLRARDLAAAKRELPGYKFYKN